MVSESILQELWRIVSDAQVHMDAETIQENSTDATKALLTKKAVPTS